MYDPDLHLFVNDDEILGRLHLPRMVHTLRREGTGAVLAPNGEDEGSGIGYASVARDDETGQFRLWYSTHDDMFVRWAVSDDARSWRKCGFATSDDQRGRVDNLGVARVGPDVAPWFGGAKFVGFCYGSKWPCDETAAKGLFMLRSMDGQSLEVRFPGVLPTVGDRSSIMLDEATGQYSLISRPPKDDVSGFRTGEDHKPRKAHLWTSRDLVEWTDRGTILRYDQHDPPDVQIYGMQPFRYGAGFLAFVEIYHEAIERLDTQLAWSCDGVSWRRVGGREAVLVTGGEGSWDSHWVVPTFNAPLPEGGRLLVPYTASCTKHGSRARHKRAIGLSSIRRDGFVSLEAGRTEGVLVTTALPLDKPMKLELNVNAHSGYVRTEVIPYAPADESPCVPGYDGQASVLEYADTLDHRVSWGEANVIQPVPAGRCRLRFELEQASFFSYRWSEAT